MECISATPECAPNLFQQIEILKKRSFIRRRRGLDAELAHGS
jgi:hypothetical protein